MKRKISKTYFKIYPYTLHPDSNNDISQCIILKGSTILNVIG